MRTLFMVLFSLVAIGGSLLGGATAWSIAAGPAHAKLADAEEMLAGFKKLESEGKVQADHDFGRQMLEQGLRATRTAEVSGVAVIVLDLALLVLALRRRATGVLVAGGLAVVLGAACFALAPSRQVDEGMYFVDTALAVAAVLAAVFAVLAVRVGGARRQATAQPAVG